MKNPLKPNILPYFTIACSAIGMALRCWLFAFGVDEKGLIVTTHIANHLCWGLTVITVAILFAITRPLKGTLRYERLFPPTIAGMLGTSAASAALAIDGIQALLQSADAFSTVTGIGALLAAVSLAVISADQRKGQKPHFGLRAIVTLFFMAHLVSQYRPLSAAAQLQDYIFPMFASVFLLLACYHRQALDAGKDSRCSYVFFSQGAAFFCLLSVVDNGVFYLLTGLWMLSDLCSLRILPPKTEEETP